MSENELIKSPDSVLECNDTVYRWVYEQPMLKSLFLLFEVWRVLLIACLIPFIIILIADSGPFLERVWGAFCTLAIPLGILLVLSIPAYLIVTKANNGKYTVLFEMDDEWVTHTQIKTDKARALELLTMLVGAKAGNPTTMGAGLLSATGGSLSSRLVNVRKITAVPGKNLIKVNSLLKRNHVYVDDAGFDFVLNFLAGHCPNARVKK